MVKPSRRRAVVEYMRVGYQVSQRQACRAAQVAVSTQRYESRRDPRTALRMRMRELANTRFSYGYRKIRVLLNREGWQVGKKLVYRLYREEGLGLRSWPKKKHRSASASRREKPRATAPNQIWSIDFVSDQLINGGRFRALTVVDIFTRECLAIEVGQSLKGHDVVRVLQRISQQRSAPEVVFCDNGSEFTGQMMDLWAYRSRVKIDFSRPGKPTDNAYVESFNGTLRAECLDSCCFESLSDAAQQIEAWRRDYNESRPHRALQERTPIEFARDIAASCDISALQIAGD